MCARLAARPRRLESNWPGLINAGDRSVRSLDDILQASLRFSTNESIAFLMAEDATLQPNDKETFSILSGAKQYERL
jgi:hypothetical protein